MSEKRIIYTNPQGGVSIVTPSPEYLLTHSIRELIAKDVPAGSDVEIIDSFDIPSDATFRNAWEKSGKVITTNLEKAKAVAHEHRRLARSAEFAPLDIEATIPSKAIQAEAAREAVRKKYADMQTAIDAATSVEQLKALLPKE